MDVDRFEGVDGGHGYGLRNDEDGPVLEMAEGLDHCIHIVQEN
jgi:hypothetical protein